MQSKRLKFEDIHLLNVRMRLYGPVFGDGERDRFMFKPVSGLAYAMLLTPEPTWMVRNSKAICWLIQPVSATASGPDTRTNAAMPVPRNR